MTTSTSSQESSLNSSQDVHLQDAPLLEVDNLCVHFPIYGGIFRRVVDQVKAVNKVSFAIKKGSTMGLVGESGSGKTTIGRAIIRLLAPTSGTVKFDGDKISSLSSSGFKPYRKKIQMIFQDPFNSLNPRLSVFSIIGEALEIHFPEWDKEKRKERVVELLKKVGLLPDYLYRYPHEFSGGQRQRIGIARALAVEPQFIICDEPVSALDVSVQAQIINLLQDLQEELNLTYLFIAHDLAVVEHMSDDVIVMEGGKLIEKASASEIYKNPQHPYTQKLLAAVPHL